MAAQTYLINYEWIIEYTPIGEFVDVKLIRPFMNIAEEVDIRSLIGKAQYDRLVLGVTNDDLSANETALLDLIRPALAYSALYRSIPWIANQVRGAGIVKTLNSNIENSSEKEVNGLEERAKSIYDYYAQRIINYLCDNSNLFPLVDNYNQDPSRTTQTRYGNFYFGDEDCTNCH